MKPIEAPDPIHAIEFVMDQRGLTRRDLEPYIGSRARVAEVLNHKRPLTLPMIRRLHAGLGIPADVLFRESIQAALNAARKKGHKPLRVFCCIIAIWLMTRFLRSESTRDKRQWCCPPTGAAGPPPRISQAISW
jgi:plasmid maintenance system antidote protein VapI